MLRLRSSILAHLLSSPATCPGFSAHRLLSSTASRIPPSPSFAVEEYLVATCGLTRAQALKASSKLSHLKSPTKPDAVLAFLARLGLSTADIAAAVTKDPKLLCAGVDRTLAPVVTGLSGLGLSRDEIARLASLAPLSLRRQSVVSNIPYYLHLFGSYENLLRILKHNSSFLLVSPEKLAKPKVALLQECGLGACDIVKLCIAVPRMLNFNMKHVHVMVACAESLGMPRGSGVFRHALHAVAFLNEEKIAARVDNLKNMFRWSDAEVSIAVSKHPFVLLKSKEMLQQRSEFLFSEAGLEPAYIAHRPALLCYSLEGRLKPRYYVVKFLKENGLLDRDRSYYSAAMATEKAFMEKYITPHDEAAPHLAEDYATVCRGEVPHRFIFS